MGLKKYKKKTPSVLVVKWDDQAETLELINKELCSKLDECNMYRLSEPNADTMVIKNVNEYSTSKTFVRVGDYVVLDVSRLVAPIFNCDEEYLTENYEPINE